MFAELLTFNDLCSLPQLSFLSNKVDVAPLLGAHAPKSYTWPEQKRAVARAVEEAETGTRWIVRPAFPVISAKGEACEAVIVSGDALASTAQRVLMEQRKALPQCSEILVQRYISNPLLFQSRKFTLSLNQNLNLTVSNVQ